MLLKRATPVLIVVLAGCASTMTVTPSPASSAPTGVPSFPDLADLRSALQHDLAVIGDRESQPPAQSANVDLDAAASIPIPDNDLVRGAVTLFTTRMRSDIQSYLTRSARYRKMIDGVLAEKGLPRALAYLPVIESGYSQTMTSRAGARGMWQFMGETAREYGLRVDWWVDERADPEQATRAAAQYIRDLYREFNDWPLTLAAYNAGPGRIRRAMTSSGATSFWDLHQLSAIPKETRGYVPTFFATLIIATDPAAYGFILPDQGDLSFRRVSIEGPVSLQYLAKVAHTDANLLRELNPALRHAIVPPGPTSIRVPTDAAETIASAAATLRNDDADIAVCTLRLRAGDSLKRIARALGTDVETLAAMNGHAVAEAGEGDSIYVPVRARDLGSLLNAEAAYYAVRKGDTLSSIARRHLLTVDELRDLNDLSARAKLHPGQRLRVSAPRTVTAGGM